MSQTQTPLLLVLALVFSCTFSVVGQKGMSNPNLKELPIVLSWDNDGARITVKTDETQSGNLLEMTPFRYLDQIGNDLIRVASGSGNTPVIIDLSEYYGMTEISENPDEGNPKINVHMPKLTLANYNEPNSFILELKNFSRTNTEATKQIFLFRGLDVFYVGTDDCAKLSALQNRIIVDVEKCDVKHLLLKGGILELEDVEEKIPNLCRKYNDRYFSQETSDAFVCLADCRKEDPNAYKNLRHSRSLITKYNITDFEDAPISYLGNMLITKKGVGLNLKTEFMANAALKKKAKGKGKKVSYNPYDRYKFFPWYEFINLSFTKYVDENQLLIRDPYNNSYIYNSKVHFSNVELIQFFNELKALISARVNTKS